ncbi:hypothetical protein MBLNU13_g06588t2 [Cladosporium sp. NU13]
MQAEASAPSTTQTQSASRPRQRRPRGPKRGRGGANASESLNFRPASVAPPAAQLSSENQAAPEASSSDNASRNRPSRRGRGRGGRGPQPDRRTADGRRFGGQLTQPDSATTQAQLQAEAAEFVPGQQTGSKPKSKAPPKPPRQQKRRMSKSQAPDIATRTHEDIDNGHYECPICTSEVQRNSKVKIFITCDCQAQKQEMKCNASKDSEGNNGRSLACNDECARLERNRKLAIALNIDKSLHTEGGDHIPYSTETLNLFGESPKFGQMQEREFRVFATSDDEKRLRFKPMKSRERMFIHHLAEDFGMDSESMDPEPHRHVMVWKTPRFVSAPNKTLAECLRIRQAQRSAAGSAYNSDAEGAKKIKASNEAAEPFNSFIISKPRFGLTVEDLKPEVVALVPSSSPVTFDIEFLPNEEIVLKAMTRTLSAQDVQQFLQNLKAPLATAISTKGLGSLQLCCTDSSLNVQRRESEASGGDGWSRVAAKKAAPRMPMASSQTSSGLNSFAALTGGKVTFAKKTPLVKPKIKKEKETVVDDWEAAEIAEEEREKVAIDGGSASEEDPAAIAKIVPVIEGDIGKITKLEEETVDSPAAQSSRIVTPSEPSSGQVMVEPKADGTPTV